jgi:hypothetical protein
MRAFVRIGAVAVVVSALVVALTGCTSSPQKMSPEEAVFGNKGVPTAENTPTAAAETSKSAGQQNPPKAAEATVTPGNAGGPPPAPAGLYSGTFTSAGISLGADLQRTADWQLGGQVWLMSSSGKDDLTGPKPQLSLLAVSAKGVTKAIWATASDDPTISSESGRFVVAIPPGTTKLQVVTSLKSASAQGDSPVLTVDLADVPVVKTITGAVDAGK